MLYCIIHFSKGYETGAHLSHCITLSSWRFALYCKYLAQNFFFVRYRYHTNYHTNNKWVRSFHLAFFITIASFQLWKRNKQMPTLMGAWQASLSMANTELERQLDSRLSHIVFRKFSISKKSLCYLVALLEILSESLTKKLCSDHLWQYICWSRWLY